MKQKDFENECSAPRDLIDFYIQDDLFVVRTPQVLSRNRSKKIYTSTCSYNNLGLVKDDTVLEEIRKQLCNYAELLTDFRNKNISIIQNHPNNNWIIPDNDNLETKRIVDTICAFCNGDSALTTSFFIAAIQEKQMKSGCYFVVTKGYGPPKFTNKLVEVLLNNFGLI